ncbi:MAG: PBSX family phage terminase large subunit [Pikeienuella sp.]
MTDGLKIRPKVARWAVPLTSPCRYKGAKGGRSGGKSHQLCELAAADMGANPDFKVAGVREVQKSIKYSLKSLLEQKIHEQGASYLFDMQDQVIKRRGYDGVAAFFGMQDHTADSVKGLEDFDRALVDEANGLSKTSLKKLTPTFRKQGSEIHFAWNPENEDDAIDDFFAANEGDPDFFLTHVNITDNPFASDTAVKEYLREKARADEARIRIAAAQAQKIDPAEADLAIWDDFNHVWLGGYNKRSQRIVFHNWREGVLDVPSNVVWFYGVDWGFATDPTAGIRACVLPPLVKDAPHRLYVDSCVSQVGVRTEDTPDFLKGVTDIERWPARADSARPEMVDYVRRHGLPKMRAARKGPGSVEDGVSFLQGLDIIAHPSCSAFIQELKTFSYKVVKRTGEILPVIEDKNNHLIDALRYAVEGLHRRGKLLCEVVQEESNRLPRPRDAYSSRDEESDSWKVA